MSVFASRRGLLASSIRDLPDPPPVLTNLTMWLDAAYIDAAANGEVLNWRSIAPASGLWNAFASSGLRPRVRGVGGPKGLPYVEFNGIDQYLQTSRTQGSTASTYFAVAYRDATSTTEGGIANRDDGAGTLRLNQFRYGAAGALEGIAFKSDQTPTTGTQAITDPQNWHVLSARCTNTQVRLSVDGTPNTLVSGGGGGPNINTSYGIGIATSAPRSGFFKGGLAALLIYNGALTDAEVLSVNNWLLARFIT